MPGTNVDPRRAEMAARSRSLARAVDRLETAVWSLDPSDERGRLEAAADRVRDAVDALVDDIAAAVGP